MDPVIELRKLPPSIVRELASILDYADSWKRLMAIIPKKLSCNGYKSDIAPDNLPKYNSEHFKIIELGGIQYKKSCTTILFDEWGTTGRPRASLGHLKYLLSKAELFRAADYVAKLLGEDPPPRPTTGPAAIISTNITEITENAAEVERHLNEINYPQVAIERIRKESLEVHKNHVPVIPEIVVSEVKTPQVSFQIPLVVPRPQTPPEENIDVSVITESDVSVVLPELSILLHQEPDPPEASQERLTEGSTSYQTSKSENTSDLSERPESTVESDLIPALSALNEDLIPNFDILQPSIVSYNTDIPLNVLQSDLNTKSSNSSSAKSPSPLPNLYLNTELPHFAYAELEIATDNFSSDKETGRFLGAGAFGSVFLAIGLLDQPVAVKKMFLDSMERVEESDLVTKQFKNEVENLFKYKQENLVSLLGYSCDGSTYCLVYEYVPGGSLFDMLEKHPGNLLWKQRLHIALGTARGIAYLHTAFSTPLIHRDIKSANILLDTENNAKLCDFGIVKLLPNQITDLETAPCGTSAYMSPEYHRGEISIKLDTFSFGVVLLELLTSLAPIDYDRSAADLVSYVEDQCEQSIDPLLDKQIGTWQENGLNFAEQLYSLTQRCLEDKEERPVMVEVVKSLESMKENIS